MANSPGDPGVRAALAGLPKIDLHRHLEGSLRLSSLYEIAQAYDLDLPARSVDELRPYVQITGAEHSFRNFLDKFNVLRRFYQSPEIIRRLAYEAVEDAARDNVRYLELRFTPPALANSRNFPLDEVTDWVIAAVEQACRDHLGIWVQLIVSLNRHEPLELAEQVTQIAIDRKDRGIAGLDLAGDEVNYPAEPFRGVFGAARQAGLGVVAHAGEWVGAGSVREAIEHLGVQRVGHGVRVVQDPSVAALARERGVVFEVCVTSNLHSGVIQRRADHPLRGMMDLGLVTTLNTDDPAVSDITLSDEYAAVIEELGLDLAGVKQSILNAANSALLPALARAELANDFRQALALGGPVPQIAADSASPPR
jgi:adenosine deaminase